MAQRLLLRLRCQSKLNVSNIIIFGGAAHRYSKYQFCANNDNKPTFKPTISQQTDTAKTISNDKGKFKRRWKRFGIIGIGVVLLYYLAMRRLQRRLDNLDLNDLSDTYIEGVTQGFNWYYKHLALGMIRSNENILNEFRCKSDELFIVKTENEPTLQDMFGVNRESMKIDFEITNKEQSIFGIVNMKAVPISNKDGNIGSFMMKNMDGKDNDLHIWLTVTMDDNEEIIVFDNLLTENGFDTETIANWFSDEEIEIVLAP